MVTRLCASILLLLTMVMVCSVAAPAIEEHHGILVGTVMKLDAGAKTVSVKLADGTERTFHFVKRTTVDGADDSAAAATDAFHGLKEGSEVAVHYTAKGKDETAEEFDNIGRDGLKSTEGTVTQIDRGGKTLTVKAADGTEQVYRMTDSAAKDAGQDVAGRTEKTAKVTVYYTEEGGHKVAHFFRKAL